MDMGGRILGFEEELFARLPTPFLKTMALSAALRAMGSIFAGVYNPETQLASQPWESAQGAFITVVDVAHFIDGDREREVRHTVTGNANDFGWFATEDAWVPEVHGEYRVDVLASWVDPVDGTLWMGSRSAASIVATPDTPFVAHGARNADFLDLEGGEARAFTYLDRAGLPWPVAHLKTRRQTGGTVELSWLPRGPDIPDSWDLPDPVHPRQFAVEGESPSGTLFTLQTSANRIETGADVHNIRVAEIGTDGRYGPWVSIAAEAL